MGLIPVVSAEEEKRIAALKAWRPAGTKFTYLGRDCCVLSHHRNMGSGFCVFSVPALNVQYADNNGQIHDLTLNESQALMIMKDQP